MSADGNLSENQAHSFESMQKSGIRYFFHTGTSYGHLPELVPGRQSPRGLQRGQDPTRSQKSSQGANF